MRLTKHLPARFKIGLLGAILSSSALSGYGFDYQNDSAQDIMMYTAQGVKDISQAGTVTSGGDYSPENTKRINNLNLWLYQRKLDVLRSKVYDKSKLDEDAEKHLSYFNKVRETPEFKYNLENWSDMQEYQKRAYLQQIFDGYLEHNSNINQTDIIKRIKYISDENSTNIASYKVNEGLVTINTAKGGYANDLNKVIGSLVHETWHIDQNRGKRSSLQAFLLNISMNDVSHRMAYTVNRQHYRDSIEETTAWEVAEAWEQNRKPDFSKTVFTHAKEGTPVHKIMDIINQNPEAYSAELSDNVITREEYKKIKEMIDKSMPELQSASAKKLAEQLEEGKNKKPSKKLKMSL